MRDGAVYELPTSAPLTDGSASSSSPGLLPTPVVADSDRTTSYYAGGNPTLIGALLPTPTVSDTNGAGAHGSGGPDLRTAVSLLPTPTAMDSSGSRGHRPDGTPYGPTSGTTLTDAAMQLLPTARATRGGSATETVYLLSSGGRSRKPSTAGND
jgi:hypothetical protein